VILSRVISRCGQCAYYSPRTLLVTTSPDAASHEAGSRASTFRPSRQPRRRHHALPLCLALPAPSSQDPLANLAAGAPGPRLQL